MSCKLQNYRKIIVVHVLIGLRQVAGFVAVGLVVSLNRNF